MDDRYIDMQKLHVNVDTGEYENTEEKEEIVED